MNKLRLFSALCTVLCVYSNAVLAASFTPLGDLPGGDFYSIALDVSADGSVVVGIGASPTFSGSEAFRWTSEGGMAGLGYLPGGGDYSHAYGVSADGSVVVGYSGSDKGIQAFRWTNEVGMVGLGDLPGGDFNSEAYSLSADGSVVVGIGASASGDEAFRWTSEGGMVGLGDLPGGDFYSIALDVSADGSVVVGVSSSASGLEAFRWTSEGGMVGLGDLPGGDFYSRAWDLSADGSVVVGQGESASGREAFRWTSEGGMVGLGYLPGGGYSHAYGVSADGSVIVGISNLGAFRWTNEVGMQSVASILTAAGVDLTGWSPGMATGVSADGHTIVGWGENPDGFTEAWMADLSDAPPTNPPVDISGTIKTIDNMDVCAMVLASGQHVFSCNPVGVFSLANLPRESNGTVKRQIYAHGFFPKVDTLPDSTNEAVVLTRSGTCPNYNTPYEPAFVPDSAGRTIYITGEILLQNSQTPICAMALANGQYMFTCDSTGSYLLKIPLDINGQFKLQVYADGFAPWTEKFDEYKTTNNVRMARAVECQ